MEMEMKTYWKEYVATGERPVSLLCILPGAKRLVANPVRLHSTLDCYPTECERRGGRRRKSAAGRRCGSLPLCSPFPDRLWPHDQK